MVPETPDRIRKRGGRLVAFEPPRITEAIFRAAREAGHPDRRLAAHISRRAVEDLAARSAAARPGWRTRRTPSNAP